MFWIPHGNDADLTELSRQLNGEGRFRPYASLWSTSGVQPALGNGTLKTSWAPLGALICVNLQLVIGSTTTFGTGRFQFTGPRANQAGRSMQGAGYASDTSASSLFIGNSYIDGGSDKIRFLITGTAGAFDATSALPFTWATGDSLELSLIYQGP